MNAIDVFLEVAAERVYQEDKWGEQNHPDFVWEARTTNYLTTADAARDACEVDFDNDKGSWTAVLHEEFCEATEEAINGNVGKLREELIQVAAVAVAWIQAIDRRTSTDE